MDIFGYIEIEARIVDKYQGIRLPLYYIALAISHIGEDGAQM